MIDDDGATRIVIHGPDRELGAALESAGATVSRVEAATADGLADAGIADADLFVLTDADRPTALVTARDANPDCRIVVYAAGTLPDFASTAADLLLDPALYDPDAVAEELVD